MKPRESASVLFVCCARRNINRVGPLESIERDLESRILENIYSKKEEEEEEERKMKGKNRKD